METSCGRMSNVVKLISFLTLLVFQGIAVGIDNARSESTELSTFKVQERKFHVPEGAYRKQSHHFVLDYDAKPFKIKSYFALTQPLDPKRPLKQRITVWKGEDILVTNARENKLTILQNTTEVVLTTSVTINRLPGAALIEISVQDPVSRHWIKYEHAFQVVGIAMYLDQGTGEPAKIFSGRDAPPILLKPLSDGSGAIGATVRAVAHPGFELGYDDLKRTDIRFVIGGTNWNGEQILPWNPDTCAISVPALDLSERCGMAFGQYFDTFSFRIPGGRDLESPVSVFLEWGNIVKQVADWNYFAWEQYGKDMVTYQTLKSERISVIRFAEALRVEEEKKASTSWKTGVIVGGTSAAVITLIAVLYWLITARPWVR